MSVPALDPALHALLRLALAVLFAAAALHKLRDPRGFGDALRGYALLPESWLPAAARAFPAAELLAMVSLLVSGAGFAALPALALLLLYSGAVAVSLARGRGGLDCGCGGPAARRGIGFDLLARNGLLLLAALACLLPAGGRPLVWVDAVTVTAGAALLSLLYAAAETALANAASARRVAP